MLKLTDQALATKILTSSHTREISVTLCTLDEKPISDLSLMVTAGQVDVDATADVKRSASFEVVDTAGVFKDATISGAYLDRMVKISYKVKSQAGTVIIPVFTGVINSVNRRDSLVTVEAQGKEILFFNPYWGAKTYTAQTPVKTVITEVCSDLKQTPIFEGSVGASELLGSIAHLTKLDSPWVFLQEIARRKNFHIFFDGMGALRVRDNPTAPAFTFSDAGSFPTLLSEPITKLVETETVNTVTVTGKAKPGDATPVFYSESLNSNGNKSPDALKVPGSPRGRYLVETIDSDAKSQYEASLIAKKKLAEIAAETENVSFTALPIPFLDEHDLLTLEKKGGTSFFRVSKMTIPLTIDNPMTIEYNETFTGW